jgi:cytoskeletal protein RodZ
VMRPEQGLPEQYEPPEFRDPLAEDDTEGKPWYRKPVVLIGWGLLVVVLIGLIAFGITQLLGGDSGTAPAPSTTTSTTPTTTTESSPTTTTETSPTTTTTTEVQQPTQQPPPQGPTGQPTHQPTQQPPPQPSPSHHHHLPPLPPVITIPQVPTTITVPPGLR